MYCRDSQYLWLQLFDSLMKFCLMYLSMFMSGAVNGGGRYPIYCLILLLFVAGDTFSQDQSADTPPKPFSLDGSLTISGTKYSVSGAARRRPPTSWTLVGTPTLSIYGVSLPFNFILSDQESSFRQPFDQFGVSPSYKWATLHIGYNSLTYSKYTLTGITFLGAGIDINPEPLRLSVAYGVFSRKDINLHRLRFQGRRIILSM